MIVVVVVLACCKWTAAFHRESELLSFNIDVKGVHLIKALDFTFQSTRLTLTDSFKYSTESNEHGKGNWVKLDLKDLLVGTWSCPCFYESPCQLKAKPAISHWLKFRFYRMCMVRIHSHCTRHSRCFVIVKLSLFC